MSDDQDDSQKTEEPTQKRLDEAAKRGQVVSSREINHFFILLALTLIVAWMMPSLLDKGKSLLFPLISSPEMIEMDPGNLGRYLSGLLGQSALLLALPFVATITAALSSGFLQNKFNISTEPLIPKLEKISPMKGFKKLFSMRSIVELIKGVIKMIIVGTVATIAVWPELQRLEQLPDEEVTDILIFTSTLSIRMLVGVCCVMFLISILDYLYQYFEYMKSMRMTKQEIKEEYKQQEGDPHIKQRLRALRMERARTRMMMAVPSSDVVITNPTHYAVALKYDSEAMGAPILVAKGADNIALKIRELAKENDIPIVENPPLARTLHANVELDQEIPYEHYKAVAEVIGYVYRMKGKKIKK